MFVTVFSILTVKYTLEIYTPESFVNDEYRLTVRIKGKGELKTANEALYEATQESQG